jgi:hypothetical protein
MRLLQNRIVGIFILTLIILTLTPPIYGQTSALGGFVPTSGSNSPNYYGIAFQLPIAYVTNNPYGGGTGRTNLMSAIAITYGGMSAVVWFYQPENGVGALLGFQNTNMPNSPFAFTPLLYVGLDGSLFAGDWDGAFLQVSTPIAPGWHMAVVEEYIGKDNYTYVSLYLDGKYVGTVNASVLPQLYNYVVNFVNHQVDFPYGYVGGGYTGGGWPQTNGEYFFYSGTIAIVAFYDVVLTNTIIQQMWEESHVTMNGINAYLPTQHAVAIYLFSPNYFNFSHWELAPYYVNNTVMEQLGVINPELTPLFYGVQNITWGNFNIMANNGETQSNTGVNQGTPANSNASSNSFLSVLPLVLIVVVAVAVVIAIVMIVRRK